MVDYDRELGTQSRQFDPQEALLDRFEQALQSGKDPSIEQFLADSRSEFTDHRHLLIELVHIDLEWRLRNQRPASLEEYFERFPELARQQDVLLELVCADFQHRQDGQDDARLVGEYVNRFPQLGSRLQLRLEELVESAGHPKSVPAAGLDGDLRCPHCSDKIEAFVDTQREVKCSSCGSFINLVDEDKTVAKTRQTFGHFELIEKLGMGQFGSVWKARDTRLDRLVAIKIPRTQDLTADDQQSFLREARAAAQLSHPRIVSVHEVGVHDGQPFIVSDLITGADLRSWLAVRRPSAETAIELAIKIATGVHAAHEAGVIHRDLKPGNILIDRAGDPHIADFGLAKRESGEITMTVQGQLLGTPAYMSPEQAKGDAHTADARSDVYSLGVILFELLTGELPFRGDKRMVLLQIISDEPPSPRKLVRISRNLDTVCLKCLRKEPHRRYASAQALADDLGRVLRNEPIHARPVGLWERTYLWFYRRPAIAVATMVTLLALTLTACILYGERRRRLWLTTNASIDALQTTRGNLVPLAVTQLRRLPQNWVRGELHRRFHSRQGDPLPLAFALASFGQLELEFLVSQIETAASADCDNFVQAFLRDKSQALAELQRQARELRQSQRWRAQARLAIVALHLGDPGIAIKMNQPGNPDPSPQTTFIHDGFADFHGDLKRLARQTGSLQNGPLRAALCLALGRLDKTGLSAAKDSWQDILKRWHEHETDAATHSASRWILQQMGVPVAKLKSSRVSSPEKHWRVTPSGFTMIRIQPGEFQRSYRQVSQRVKLTREFWLSDAEVTVKQFSRFIDDQQYKGRKPGNWPGVSQAVSPTVDHPVQQVSWEDAVLYCNWLSHREGLKPCYTVKPMNTLKSLFQANARRLGDRQTLNIQLRHDGTGYRLPTEAEWEYASRAGVSTRFCFGDDTTLLGRYAVFGSLTTQPPRSRMCNRWGLFDVHGNVFEWCYDRLQYEYSGTEVVDPTGPAAGKSRIYRGGGATLDIDFCMFGLRVWGLPGARQRNIGLRLAQNR